MFRKRWARRLVYSLISMAAVLAVGMWWDRKSTLQDGEANLAAVVAELDQKYPRWRWDALEEDRERVPDDKNGALLVPKFKTVRGIKSIKPYRPNDGSDPFDGLPINRHLSLDDYALVERGLIDTEAAGAVALQFKDRPKGFRRVQLHPERNRMLEYGDRMTEEIAEWLGLDVERQARNDRGSAALIRCLAILNCGRSIGMEPVTDSQLDRLKCAGLAVNKTERVVALISSDVGLIDLQAALLEESLVNQLQIMARSLLADEDRRFRIQVSRKLGSIFEDESYIPRDIAKELKRTMHLPGDHAFYLHYRSQLLDATKLPEHTQRSVLLSLQFTTGDGWFDKRLWVTLPFIHFHDADIQNRARLRCAAAGMAVERFRWAKGRWPKTLDEIPKDILTEIPLDPYDGKPLKYIRRRDGVTVYATGNDAHDDHRQIYDELPEILQGQAVGFRLYDVDQRGLPALAPKPPARRDE